MFEKFADMNKVFIQAQSKKFGWLSKLLEKLNRFEILTRIFSVYGPGNKTENKSYFSSTLIRQVLAFGGVTESVLTSYI